MNAYRTIRGNTLSAIAAALLLAFTASAMPSPTVGMRFDCGHRYIGMGDAARLFGSNNASQVYARRQALYANLARACAARRASAAPGTGRSDKTTGG